MGSRFRYSGHTEFQNAVAGGRARRTVSFVRTPSQRYARRQSHVLREKKKAEEKVSIPETEATKSLAEVSVPLSKPAVVDTPRDSAPSPTLVLNLSASPSATPRGKSSTTSPRSHTTKSPRDGSMNDLTQRAVKSLPNTSRAGTTDDETRLETLLNIKMDESETKSSVPNNQIPTQPAKPLPADSYKNNLLKAKAEEEIKAEFKNAELSSSAENVIRSVYLDSPGATLITPGFFIIVK